MARPKSIRLAAINIHLQPPRVDSYVELWQALYDLDQPIKIRGDRAVMLGTINPINERDLRDGFRGLIFRFTEIDFTKPWFNRIKKAEADGELVKSEVKVPDYLMPNMKQSAYVFFPRSHRLVLESDSTDNGSISPASVESLIESLLQDEGIKRRFPNVECDVEQDRENIRDILGSKSLSALVITVKKPNPDGPEKEMADDVFRQMEAEGLQRKTVALKAPRGGSITPGKETTKLAQVAASNGSVVAQATGATGKKVVLSSKSKPQTLETAYNPDQTALFEHFETEAQRFVGMLKGETPWSPTNENKTPPVV